MIINKKALRGNRKAYYKKKEDLIKDFFHPQQALRGLCMNIFGEMAASKLLLVRITKNGYFWHPMPITFHTADVKFSLKQKKELKAFIHSQILKLSNCEIAALSFVFCSDEYLLAINKKFLNHDYYTDIITFPLSEDEQSLAGEIYISIDRVKENSLQFAVRGSQLKAKRKVSNPQFEAELNRVIFHGVLHLLGYKDKTKAQKAKMRKMENKWLKSYELRASSRQDNAKA